MKKRKGFTLVELMVVVAIIAILAAVGLPMYSTFRQKARVGTALKAVQGTLSALTSWHDLNDDFSGITLNQGAAGGALMAGSTEVGIGLPEVNDCAWSLDPAPTQNSIVFTFIWNANAACPNARCDGRFCFNCDTDENKCYISVAVGDGTLGMDRSQTNAMACAAP